jgi:capsular polysaccharide biosynthesis protein
MPAKAIPRTGPQEMHGGLFAEDSSFIAESALLRGVRSPIMAYGRHAEAPIKKVQGNVVYGGFLYASHYGHFLIESLARLWRCVESGEFDGVYFHAHPGNTNIGHIAEYFLPLLGIDLRKVFVIAEPIQFENITVPAAAIRIGGGDAHYVQGLVYSAIAEAVTENYLSPKEKNSPPIYFSRTRLGQRPVFGEEEIERELVENGWEVVYPEQLSIKQQIETARRSSVYCGVIGSAMHNLLFADRQTRVFYIEREPSQKTSYKTLECQDKIAGLKSRYIGADVKSETIAGPFLINPNIVLNALHEQLLIEEPKVLDMREISSRYEAHVAENR